MIINRASYATTLEKKVTKYLRKFGITRALCTDQFAYVQGANTVLFTIIQYKTDADFIKYINEKYDVDIEPWFFVFSLLHEIGHHMTLHLLTAEDMAFEKAVRETMLPMLGLTAQETNDIYFKLPAEDLANTWALDYIENHIEECWKFQQKCYKIMRHIFKKKSFPY